MCLNNSGKVYIPAEIIKVGRTFDQDFANMCNASSKWSLFLLRCLELYTGKEATHILKAKEVCRIESWSNCIDDMLSSTCQSGTIGKYCVLVMLEVGHKREKKGYW
jgi:hypothetical protein